MHVPECPHKACGLALWVSEVSNLLQWGCATDFCVFLHPWIAEFRPCSCMYSRFTASNCCNVFNCCMDHVLLGNSSRGVNWFGPSSQPPPLVASSVASSCSLATQISWPYSLPLDCSSALGFSSPSLLIQGHRQGSCSSGACDVRQI